MGPRDQTDEGQKDFSVFLSLLPVLPFLLLLILSFPIKINYIFLFFKLKIFIILFIRLRCSMWDLVP